MKVAITQNKIDTATIRLGAQLLQDYEDKNPVVIGVLNGCYMFMSDLTKKLTIDHEIDFVRIRSYHKNKSTGKVHFTKSWETDLKNRHILLVEDIVDTGLTLEQLMVRIRQDEPASVEVVTLLKRSSCKLPIKYVGYTVEDDAFLVGYGMDNDEKSRNLTNIYKL